MKAQKAKFSNILKLLLIIDSLNIELPSDDIENGF